MALYKQIRFNAFNTRNGNYRVVLSRNEIDHDIAAADTIDLDERGMLFSDGLPISHKYEDNGTIMWTEIGSVELDSPFQYSGTVNGSPVSGDLTSTGLTILENFHDSDTAIYRLWLDRKKNDGTWEYRFVGDYERKDFKATTYGIIDAANSSTEKSCKRFEINAAPMWARLKNLTVSDLSFDSSDMTKITAVPFQVGLRLTNKYSFSEELRDIVQRYNGGENVKFNLDSGVRAKVQLSALTNIGNGETMTLGSKTYTFQTTLTNVDGNIKIGATTYDTFVNIWYAVNLIADGGTVKYAAAMTANADVEAEEPDFAVSQLDTAKASMRFRAKVGGTAGNSLASTETFGSASNVFSSSTLLGGLAGTGLTPPYYDGMDYVPRAPVYQRFPSPFYGVSIYNIFSAIFNHASVNFAFTTADYDDIPIQLFGQKVNGSLFDIDETTGERDIQNLILNYNVFFGYSPYAIRISSTLNGTVNTQEDHNFTTGQLVYISNVTSDAGIDGSWMPITVVDSNTFTLDNYVGSGSSTLEGVVGLMLDTPITWKGDTTLEQVVTELCISCGFVVDCSIDSSGNPKVKLRERGSTLATAIPSNFQGNGVSGETTENDYIPAPSLSLGYKGDEDRIYVDHKPTDKEEKIELDCIFRTHALADIEGNVYGRHLIYSDKYPITEQDKVEFAVNAGKFNNVPEGWVVGSFITRYVPDTGANTRALVYGSGYDNIGVGTDKAIHIGFSITQYKASEVARTSRNYNFGESYLYCLAQFYGNVLRLYPRLQVTRTYNTIVDGSLNINWLQCGVTTNFYWFGADRNWIAIQVDVNDKSETVTITWEEQRTYATLEEFTIITEGTGSTSGGASVASSGSQSTGSTSNSDINALIVLPNSLYRNIAKPSFPTYHPLGVQQASSSQSADLFPIYNPSLVSLSGFNSSGNLFFVETGGGTDRVVIKAPSSLAASITLTLPNTDGNANDVLISDGSGNLSFVDVDSIVTPTTPAGLDTYVQYNDGLVFGGDAGFLFNETTDALTLGVSSSTNGSIVLKNSSNSNAITLLTPVVSSSYSFKFPTTGGTNTYLLQTDGSGNTSWVNPTSLVTDLSSAVILNPLSLTRNFIDLTGDYHGLKIQAFSSQSNYLIYLESNAAGTFYGGFDPTGKLVLRNATAVAGLIQLRTNSTDPHGINIESRFTSPSASDYLLRINDGATGAILHMVVGGTGLIGMNGTADTNAILRIVSSTGASGIGLKIKADSNSSSMPIVFEDSSAAIMGGVSYNGVLSVGLSPLTAGIGMIRAYQATNGGAMMRYITNSGSTTDDIIESTIYDDITTTNATVTTLTSFNTTSDHSYHISCTVLARRTGGSGGAAGDTASYVLEATIKDVSGTASVVGAVSANHTGESQAGWNATIDTTGGTVRVRVTGALNNNISWHCKLSSMELNA